MSFSASKAKAECAISLTVPKDPQLTAVPRRIHPTTNPPTAPKGMSEGYWRSKSQSSKSVLRWKLKTCTFADRKEATCGATGKLQFVWEVALGPCSLFSIPV